MKNLNQEITRTETSCRRAGVPCGIVRVVGCDDRIHVLRQPGRGAWVRLRWVGEWKASSRTIGSRVSVLLRGKR